MFSSSCQTSGTPFVRRYAARDGRERYGCVKCPWGGKTRATFIGGAWGRGGSPAYGRSAAKIVPAPRASITGLGKISASFRPRRRFAAGRTDRPCASWRNLESAPQIARRAGARLAICGGLPTAQIARSAIGLPNTDLDTSHEDLS